MQLEITFVMFIYGIPFTPTTLGDFMNAILRITSIFTVTPKGLFVCFFCPYLLHLAKLCTTVSLCNITEFFLCSATRIASLQFSPLYFPCSRQWAVDVTDRTATQRRNVTGKFKSDPCIINVFIFKTPPGQIFQLSLYLAPDCPLVLGLSPSYADLTLCGKE